MLHCVHLLVTNSVILLFCAEQVVCCEFIELLQLPALAVNNAIRAVRVNQQSKVAARQLNNKLKLTTKSCEMMMRRAADSGNNTL